MTLRDPRHGTLMFVIITESGMVTDMDLFQYHCRTITEDLGQTVHVRTSILILTL